MSSTDNAESAVRRSGRKRVSTTIKVQGFDVKRQNNYTVNAISYEMGTHTEDPEKKKPRTEPRKSLSKTNQPRKQSEAEKSRLQHNDIIKAAIEAKKSFRMDFLSQNKDVLNPFIDEHTRQKLQEWSSQKKNDKPYRKEELYVQPDLMTGGEMRDYQLAGLNFMLDLHKQNIGMILGDEMGLGKTCQTISLLAHLKAKDEKCGPSLVVCPLSVLYSWCAELKRWAPSLKVLRLHASNADEQDAQRKEVTDHGTSYDVIVTTYEMCKAPQLLSMWARLYFRLCVLDEGHKIKSRDTKIAQAVRKIHCETRLILTGTPLQNNLGELVALLNFLLPDIFTDFKTFEDAFNITNNHIDKAKMMQAQKVLDLLMIRRLKDQVEKLLPPKIETKVYCPLSKQQVFWYKNLLMKDINHLVRVQDKEDGAGIDASAAQKLRSLFAQLRKATIHPFLFDGAETDIAATTLPELTAASGKLAVLDSLLRSLFVKGHRVCLFSQFTSVLDIITDYCTMRGWKHCSFDGRTCRAKRNYLINAFNAPDSPYFLFLMSTRSGGLGVNLQSADTVVLFDSDWNPQADLQAIARCHRLGQTKTVHIYRLVSGGTIEERILERAEKKLLLDQMVNRGKSTGVESEEDAAAGLSAADILVDIKFGSAAIFGDPSLNTLPTQEQIDFITNRSRTEEDSAGLLKGNAYHRADTFDANQELSDTQTFEGVDFKSMREELKKKEHAELPETMKGIAHLWKEISQLKNKRQIKNRVMMVQGNGSGYGTAYVPVLAANNYDLQHGESSVFARELSSTVKENYAVPKKIKGKAKFEHQRWCQHCGDGGLLHLCSRCPMVVHEECCRRAAEKGTFSCNHHWCSLCFKSSQHAGGILYPCQSCPSVFCEDCLPKDQKGFRILGQCDRLERLGFDSTKSNVYIHCSAHCEAYAKEVWGWKPPVRGLKQQCPEELDVSYNFASSEEPRVAKKARKPPMDRSPIQVIDLLSDDEAEDKKPRALDSTKLILSSDTQATDEPTACLTTSASSSSNSDAESEDIAVDL